MINPACALPRQPLLIMHTRQLRKLYTTISTNPPPRPRHRTAGRAARGRVARRRVVDRPLAQLDRVLHRHVPAWCVKLAMLTKEACVWTDSQGVPARRLLGRLHAPRKQHPQTPSQTDNTDQL